MPTFRDRYGPAIAAACDLIVKALLAWLFLAATLFFFGLPRPDAERNALLIVLIGLMLYGMHRALPWLYEGADELPVEPLPAGHVEPFLDARGRAIQPGDELLYLAFGGEVVVCEVVDYGPHSYRGLVLSALLPDERLAWFWRDQTSALLSFAPGTRTASPDHYADELGALVPQRRI
jgi:hypothetical protein